MVGFGSSLRMSRRRGWEDAYLDYASLRLLLTQIEAVYEEEDWKAHPTHPSTTTNGGANNNGGVVNNNGGSRGFRFGGYGAADVEGGAAAGGLLLLDEDDDMMDDDAESNNNNSNNNGKGNIQSILQGLENAWDTTVSMVTGQPPPPRKKRRGAADRYHEQANRQQQQQEDEDVSEYFEYSPNGGRKFLHHRRNSSRVRRREKKSSSNNNGGEKKSNKSTSNNTTVDEDDDDDRALDKGGWRTPGVLDYRDELFIESDDELAFGYYDNTSLEEEEEDENAEEEEGMWIDEEDDVEGEIDHQYSGEFLMNDEEDNEYSNRPFDIIVESSSDTVSSKPSMERLVERASSDDSNIKAELASANATTLDHVVGDSLTPERVVGGGDNNSTPKSHLPETPINNNKSLVQFTQSPGVLEAGYETFAVAAARQGDLGGAQEHSMYVGSPSEQGWFDFIPNLLGNRQKQQQQQQQKGGESTGESRPLLSQDGVDESSPSPNDENNVVLADTSSLVVGSESPHGYTSLRSKTSPVRFLPAPRRLSNKNDDDDDDDIESKFSSGPSAFMDKKEMLAVITASSSDDQYRGGEENNTFATSSPRPQTRYRTSPVMATAIGSSMPMTPTTPPMTPPYRKKKLFVEQNIAAGDKGIVGSLGVPIQMIPTEAVELLRPNSPRKSPTLSNFGTSRFYSFQNDEHEDDSSGSNDDVEGGEHRNSKEEANMINYYSGGGRGGDNFSLLRSPPNTKPRYSYRQQHHGTSTSQKMMKGMPSLSSNTPTNHQFLSENPIMNLLLGRSVEDWDPQGGRSTKMAAGKKKKKSKVININRGHHQMSRKSVASNTIPTSYNMRSTTRQTRAAAAAAKSKRARFRRRQRQLRRQREERIPQHLRVAHIRAAAITERFRGLLRAEVEKVILFANSRLGELSDTIGCLRYSSYEDEQDERKAHPHLADGGIHQLSSSDEEDGGGHHASDASSSSDGEAQNLDITIEQDASTRRQIIMRDRMRMMRPLFQKADFLGEDFSLLSAVDEADAYAAVGVELMHLLKFVCVNIIAVRKICKKHDRLLSNRMLGGYYQRLAAEAKKSQNAHGGYHQFHWNEPQFGGTLSNPAASSSNGGYIYGIYDTKIQHIANSTTMQTVSSSLSIALADFEASQSRSALLGLGFEPTMKEVVSTEQEVPTPRHRTSSKSHGGVLSYQLGGHCFRGDDDSSAASQEKGDDNESTSSNVALTRLQFVVTSIFGLREAARIKVVPFEQYASRLFMTSTGPNVVGDGLDGCSRETLDLLCSYNPDAAYTLDSETLHASLKIGRENEGIGSVMVASLAAAAKGSDMTSTSVKFRRKVSAAMCIKPQLAGEVDNSHSSLQAKNRNILGLNTSSMVLFLVNYHCIVPVAHIHSIELGAASGSALLIGAVNVTSMLSASVHVLLASKRKSFAKKHLDVSFFRLPLIISALFPLIGNILYSLSVNREDFRMALIGRLLIGLGSAEVLNRRLVSTIMPKESVNAEVASMVKKSMLAMTVGLLLGSLVDVQVRKQSGYNSFGRNLLLDPANSTSIGDLSNATIASINGLSNETITSNAPVAVPVSPPPQVQNGIASEQPFLPFYPLNPPLLPFGYQRLLPLQSTGIIMACLWFLQMVGLIFFFDAPGRKEELITAVDNSFENNDKVDVTLEEDFDSDSAGSERAKTLSMHVSKPSYDSMGSNPFVAEGLLEQEEIGTHGTFEKLQTMSRKTVKNQYKGSYLESLVSVRRLAMSNIAFPTSISLLFLARAVNEALLSSCATIMYRFFWCSGAKSGLFLGVITSFILPINWSFSTEKNFTERSIIKTALVIARYGLLLMVNYESLFYSMKNLIFRSANKDHSFSYDGFLGAVQYIVSFAVVFMSMASLESVTLTLMSKVSPNSLRKYSLDSSFAVIFVSSLGRLVGDLLIWATELSSWVFFNSIINTLCCCLIVCLLVGSYVVKKHYFFLI
jgi:hypothetical protein